MWDATGLDIKSRVLRQATGHASGQEKASCCMFGVAVDPQGQDSVTIFLSTYTGLGTEDL
jgi:hypothetical protein